MSALTQWVERLEARVERIEASNRTYVPPQQYNAASVVLEQLVVPFGRLSQKHRFARAVTGSTAGVDLDEVAESIRRLLEDSFQAFVSAHLSRSTTSLGDQVRALKGAIEAHMKVLDGHVDSFRKRTDAEMESVHVQVKLFRALSISDHQADYDKLKILFTVLMRQYGLQVTASTLESNLKAMQQALTTLRNAVSFDERLNLSPEALAFMRRILAGRSQAPTLLELTPALLTEIQKLREFAGTIRILRAE